MRRVLLAAGVLALACVGAEVAHRLWLYGPAGFSPARLASVRPLGDSDLVVPADDPRVGYALRPGYLGWFQLARFSTDGRGLRRHPGSAEAEGPPLVALGDSYTMGSGVADDETWPARLERLLRGRRVLNFGVGGYGLLHELAVLERALELEPTQVVVGLSWNDVEPPPADHFARLAGQAVPRPAPLPARPFLRGTLLDRLGRAPAARPEPAEEQAVAWLRALGPEGSAGDDYVALAIGALAERCRSAGVPLLFVFLSTGTGEPGAEAAERFRDAAAAAGADFLDTRARLARYPRGALIARPDDGHPNARAHALYAEAVAEQLAAELSGRLDE